MSLIRVHDTPAAKQSTSKTIDEHYLRFQTNRPLQMAGFVQMLRKTDPARHIRLAVNVITIYFLIRTFQIPFQGCAGTTSVTHFFQVGLFQCG